MSDFIEGPIKEIRHWSDGKGADVYLDQDPVVYYYHGKLDIHLGKSCKFEVKEGEGEHKDKKEIINCSPLVTDFVHPGSIQGLEQKKEELKKGLPPPPPPPGRKLITMPMEDFQTMMQTKMALKESRVRALEAAVKVYAALRIAERDPSAAAEDVVEIAAKLEGYLL